MKNEKIQETFIEKNKTHIVLKVDDIEKALNSSQKSQLSHLLELICDYREKLGKEPKPNYFIINDDEPYSITIKEVIISGEKLKKNAMQI